MKFEGSGRDIDESGAATLPDRAREASERARTRTLEGLDRSSERVRSELGETKHQLVDQIRHMSEALHSTAASADDEGSEPVARYARIAGERLDSAADYLSETSAGDWVRDAERYARRRPAV